MMATPLHVVFGGCLFVRLCVMHYIRSMRETQTAQSESHKQNLTVCIPMEQSNHAQALDVFKHLDGQLPNIADAEVVDTTYWNDAAFSCEVKMQSFPMAGLKLFLANPDEGYDSAQIFAGRHRDELMATFKTVEEVSEWLFKQMQPNHPFFKELGIQPLVVDSKEGVIRYLTLLRKHGLEYHMDDCPWDCLRNQDLTIWERLLIEYYDTVVWNVCDEIEEDIHGLCLEVYEL